MVQTNCKGLCVSFFFSNKEKNVRYTYLVHKTNKLRWQKQNKQKKHMLVWNRLGRCPPTHTNNQSYAREKKEEEEEGRRKIREQNP